MILTTASMFRAAERKLAAHRKTRPATTAEASAIARGHRQIEAAYREAASQIYRPQSPSSLAERLAESIAVAQSVKDAAHATAAADRAAAQAQAWERVAAGPEGEAWRETERALVERVEYYREQLKLELGRAS